MMDLGWYEMREETKAKEERRTLTLYGIGGSKMMQMVIPASGNFFWESVSPPLNGITGFRIEVMAQETTKAPAQGEDKERR